MRRRKKGIEETINRIGCCSLALTVAGIIWISASQNTFAEETFYQTFQTGGLNAGKTAPENENIPGWAARDGRWQYRLSKDVFVCGGWIKSEDGWYYFDTDGNMATDTTLEIGGHTYTFDSSGAWRETVPADLLFVNLPSGRVENFVYEHPWAEIRITLPENSMISTADQLRNISAQDYVPSYYDFFAVVPGQGMIGTVIQYNSDPLEKILADDLEVFSNFRGEYDFQPAAPQSVSLAGYPSERITCSLAGDRKMEVYLHKKDNKVLYLYVIAPAGEPAAARRLAERVGRID